MGERHIHRYIKSRRVDCAGAGLYDRGNRISGAAGGYAADNRRHQSRVNARIEKRRIAPCGSQRSAIEVDGRPYVLKVVVSRYRRIHGGDVDPYGADLKHAAVEVVDIRAHVLETVLLEHQPAIWIAC